MNGTNPMLTNARRCAMALVLTTAVGCGFQTGALPDPSGGTGASTTSLGTVGSTVTSGPDSTVTSMTSDSTGPTDRGSTSGDGSGDSTGGGTGSDRPGPCCRPSSRPGCESPGVETCVCEVDPFCCEQGWDALCVDEVSTLGCGECPGSKQPPSRPCCGPADGPGCGDPMLEGCVCDMDPYCCQVRWDDTCADQVDALGCGQCLDPGTLSDDCCVEHPEAGCSDSTVQDCVCGTDPFCCDTVWDDVCVGQVTELGCGMCEPSSNRGDQDCCTTHDTPGCDDPMTESCVCATDPFCCQVSWDALCVGEAEDLCAACDSSGGSTGTGGGAGTTGASTSTTGGSTSTTG